MMKVDIAYTCNKPPIHKFREGTLYIITRDYKHEHGIQILYCTTDSDSLYGFILYCEHASSRMGSCNHGDRFNAAAWEEFHGEIKFTQP
jgi:hypothetical protein